VRKVSYNSIASLFELSQGVSLDSVPLSEMTAHQKTLAADYVAAFKLDTYTPEQVMDVQEKMGRMVYALEKIVPGIWDGQSQVFIALDRKTIEQDERFQSVFPVLEALVAEGKVGFIPPMYDLKAVMAFEKALAIGAGHLDALPDEHVSAIDNTALQVEFERILISMNQRSSASPVKRVRAEQSEFFQSAAASASAAGTEEPEQQERPNKI
jgi:hypothetical protein